MPPLSCAFERVDDDDDDDDDDEGGSNNNNKRRSTPYSPLPDITHTQIMRRSISPVSRTYSSNAVGNGNRGIPVEEQTDAATAAAAAAAAAAATAAATNVTTQQQQQQQQQQQRSNSKLYTRRRTHSPVQRSLSHCNIPPTPNYKNTVNHGRGWGGGGGGGGGALWQRRLRRIPYGSPPHPSSSTTTTTTITGKTNPTTMLGLLLFGLVCFYMLIVLIVTHRHLHWQDTILHDTQSNINDNINGNNNGREFRDSLAQAAEGMAETIKQQQQSPPPPSLDTGNNHALDNAEIAPAHKIDPESLFQITSEDIAVAALMNQDLKDEQHQHPTPQHILTAYMEQVDYDEWFTIRPLPNRSDYTARAELLTKQTYSRVNRCSRLLQQWPVDDTPADGDPYLPWIHDVFPSADGRHVHFVAQNKRRCDTGRNDGDLLKFRQGQAALFQHVPIRRVVVVNNGTTSSAAAISSDHDNTDPRDGGNGNREIRYQLTTHEQADPDAIETRFICRFSNGDEIPSVFHFDYDWTSYRKRYPQTFKEDDGGIKSIHTSQLLFSCPIPRAWHDTVRTGQHVQDDWTKLFVDLIPIRTPPRYGKPTQFLQPRYAADDKYNPTAKEEKFNPRAAWGEAHILPRIIDSGRWANIPICLPSLLQYEYKDKPDEPNIISGINNTDRNEPSHTVAVDASDVHHQHPPPHKKHRIVSCLWASAGYRTRGERFAINDGQRRLLEWITYHQDVLGFDHVYLYDNSGAFTNETSLKPVADMFPDTVTYIGWPSQICNNRPNNVDSPGERSSQYAAEASCRLRFGPHVDWIGQFDVDEYLVPMGDYQNIGELLDHWDAEDTRIVSFASWRAWPRWSMINPIVPIDDKALCGNKNACFDLSVPAEHTIFQTYNCDRFMPGKKGDKMPAEKQIYRPAYVYQHFVHYSAVTELSVKNSTEYQAAGFKFPARPFPDPRQRFGGEEDEALMIHSKAIARQDTAGWEMACHTKALERPKKIRGLCRLGVPWPEPWPEDPERAPTKSTEEGWMYNCFVNPKAEKVFAPRLRQALEVRAPMLGPQSFKESIR